LRLVYLRRVPPHCGGAFEFRAGQIASSGWEIR
jgi:hypothetical protein